MSQQHLSWRSWGRTVYLLRAHGNSPDQRRWATKYAQTRAVLSYYGVDSGIQDPGIVARAARPPFCSGWAKWRPGYTRLVLEDDKVSASKSYWLIVKRFCVQITASTLQRFLRVTLHWVTVKARSGLQHQRVCASHLRNSFPFALTIHSFCRNIILPPIAWYSRAKVACETSPTRPANCSKEKTDSTHSNNIQLAIITVRMHM